MNQCQKKNNSTVIYWFQASTQKLIHKKYDIYGYTSLEKLAEWHRLIPKKEQHTSSFISKKEYKYINLINNI